MSTSFAISKWNSGTGVYMYQVGFPKKAKFISLCFLPNDLSWLSFNLVPSLAITLFLSRWWLMLCLYPLFVLLFKILLFFEIKYNHIIFSFNFLPSKLLPCTFSLVHSLKFPAFVNYWYMYMFTDMIYI